MNLFDFIVTVVVVTASGALAPGPLFFATIMHGTKQGAFSGFSCAIGHTIVEFPLVLALALGLLAAASQPFVKGVIGVVGGIGLIVFGVLQIYQTFKHKAESSETIPTKSLPASSVVLGIALTGLNPYFVIWWLSIGSVLIVQALAFGAIIGVLLMYVSHVWMDYAFLTALAHLGKKSRSIIDSRYYKLLLLAFGLILIYYGGVFVEGALRA
jgi:threonine/homoserine/homoserine lactone efflux protein